MLKKFILIVIVAGTMQQAYSQSTAEKPEKTRRGRPDIPGTFLIDFGFNFPSTDSVNFNTGIWGSRTLNLYYQLDKRIGQTKFSLHPGAGFGFDRYKFNNEYTLGYIAGPDSPFDTLRMVPGRDGTKKSQLMTNYLDAMFEVRFSTNPNDPARSFKAALGFKAGILINAYAKVKYSENGETKKYKDRQDWNVNDFRYGVVGRIGLGNFNLFGYYSLTPIFKDGKGPDMAEISTVSVGLSLAGF
jgi:hypothetical protein